MDAEWTATALFSPSKARWQQAQAKDWAVVDAWLAKRYGSRIPNFERNEETLQALLTLANRNETAEEQRNQSDRVERAALQAFSRRQAGIRDDVLHSLQVELADETHIETLASITAALDCPSLDALELGGRLVDLTSFNFEMAQQIKRTETQLAALQAEQARVKQLLIELEGDPYQAPADVVETTAEWTRSAKHLKAKIGEYEERLATSRPSTDTGITIDMVQKQVIDLNKQREQLAELQIQLKAFQDLPADSRAARQRLEEAQDQLQKLVNERDRLFESMATG